MLLILFKQTRTFYELVCFTFEKSRVIGYPWRRRRRLCHPCRLRRAKTLTLGHNTTTVKDIPLYLGTHVIRDIVRMHS